MAHIRTQIAESLERRSSTLFLLAGMALFLLLVVGWVVRFTGASISRTAYWPLFPFAIGLALLGLAGLYPRLVARAPTAARVGLGLAIFGAIAQLGGTVVLVVTAPPGPYPGNLGVLGAPFFLGLLAFVPAVGMYGASSLWTGTAPRRVGTLLLVISFVQFAELLGVLFVFPGAGGVTQPSRSYLLFENIAYGVIVIAMVTVGYSLRTSAPPAEHADTQGTVA